MTEALTPEQAAPIVGVPAVQLSRWAWLGVGPKNVGTKYKPKFLPEELEDWRNASHPHPC